MAVLSQIEERAWHVFWPDEVQFEQGLVRSVIGHRQVTDAYLVGLASHFGATLVTLDKGLATMHRDSVTLSPTRS